MRAIQVSFLQMFRQMRKDFMLFILLFVPFLAGGAFRFIIPIVEQKLCRYFLLKNIIAPYYQVIDALLILLTPTLVSFVSALIMLEEADDGIISYLSVTPLGKSGYLVSRLGLTTLITIPLNILLASLFHLAGFGLLDIFLLSLAGAAQGVVVALLIVALSSNKVEGMALGKLTSLLTLGLIVPYFIKSSLQPLFWWIPSYWMGKFLIDGSSLCLGISIFVVIGWILLLAKKFIKKIQ